MKQAASKNNFSIMGENQNSLAEAVNTCIAGANKGKAMAAGSPQIKDMLAHLASLGE